MSKVKRPERLTLKQERDVMFDNFRRNLRVLRANVDISAVELSNKIKLKNGKRCVDLEYGRGNPSLEELMGICDYFKVSMDDLMNKKITVTFQP